MKEDGRKTMVNIDMRTFTALEQKIHTTALEASKSDEKLTVNKVAALSGCSISKVTKFTQKAGFQNFKQYMGFVYGRDMPQKPVSGEVERLKLFLENFDCALADEFIALIRRHKKIVLFGYGPSLICVQYFEYKLRILTDNLVFAVPDETMVAKLLDETSLFVIFSTSGRFRSFKPIYDLAKEKGSETLLIVEEYNTSLLAEYDKIMFLTQSFQNENLRAYDKSRSVFFFFIEEIASRLLRE